MNRTGVVTHPLYIQHDPGSFHPESPDRLRAILAELEQDGLTTQLQAVTPRVATQEEIEWVHTPSHYKNVAATEGRSVALDADTHTSPESFQAALLAAGGAMALCQAVVRGELDNGMALIRPPGHHAESTRAMGFCLFNNVAIVAQYAKRKLGLEKVLIVDWDLHHGNGTMHSFYQQSDVLYFSTHQYPYYPGTGALEDIGRGPGEGYTVNVPLYQPMGDLEFRAIFRDILAPVARQFSPDLILVSAGFDTYHRDPLGSMKMTEEGYGALTHQMMEMASAVCKGRLVMMLEGGYHIQGQAQSVALCFQTLLGSYHPPKGQKEQGAAKEIIEAVRRTHQRTWKFD